MRPDIKLIYNSRHDDIIEDFFNKALKYYNRYDRVSAYFDSDILTMYSKGIKNIVINNGKIRFIFSEQITEKDYNLIKKGYEDRKKKIIEEITSNFDEVTESDEISNLAYLISIGVVDIKIALTKKGIFHDKFGLIYDENDTILFRGSANETKAAIEKNYDSFETSLSWDLGTHDIINYRKNNFDNLWNNSEEGVIVLDVTDIAKNKLIKYNKGKIIDGPFDKIYFYYDKELFMENRLEEPKRLQEESYFYNNEIKYRIKKVIDKKYSFYKGNNYHNIIDIIELFQKHGEINNFNIQVDESVNDFINSRRYEIDRLRSVGEVIKKDEIIKYEELSIEFIKFNNIIQNEMTRVLRYPQLLGAFHLSTLLRTANFSVPGSGKTTTAYGAYAYLNSEKINKVDKIVMIGPLNSFNSWIEEFYANFGVKKQLNYFDITNYSNKNHALKWETSDKNLILINYEMLPYIDEDNYEIINDRTLLIFDEIHRIKKIDGTYANAAFKISENAKYITALTGTPIPNGYQDLYNMLNLLYRDDYDHYFRYNTRQLSEANSNQYLANSINESIYPFFIRTTKKELGIPAPNKDEFYSIRSLMTKEEQTIFKILYRTYRDNYLLLYLRLLQASINPSLVLKEIDYKDLHLENEKDDIERFNYLYKEKEYTISKEDGEIIMNHGPTTKFKKGIDIVEKLVREKKTVLVWAVFIDNMKLIYNELKNKGIKVDIIYGEIGVDDRKLIINKFKNREIDVLVANPHTISESVSLHHACHDAVYFEYTFNLTHMLQSKDRINRLGLKNDQYTQYYYLSLYNGEDIYNSIDEKTYLRLKEKEKLMIDAIEGEHLNPTPFDDLHEDIKYIFKSFDDIKD